VPFRAKSFGEYVVKHLTEPPVPPRRTGEFGARIPARLETAVLRCLHKHPAERFETMHELRAELEGIREDLPPAELEAQAGRGWRASARGAWILAGVSACAALAAGAILVLWLSRSGPGSPGASPTTPVVPAAPASAGTAAPAAAMPDTPSATTPARITLSFESTPRGAHVGRAGEDRVLCVTPCRLEFPREDRRELFLFSLPGHGEVRLEIPLLADGTLAATMPPKAAPPGEAGKGRKALAAKPGRGKGPKGKGAIGHEVMDLD
jgi:hypothetical protein